MNSPGNPGPDPDTDAALALPAAAWQAAARELAGNVLRTASGVTAYTNGRGIPVHAALMEAARLAAAGEEEAARRAAAHASLALERVAARSAVPAAGTAGGTGGPAGPDTVPGDLSGQARALAGGPAPVPGLAGDARQLATDIYACLAGDTVHGAAVCLDAAAAHLEAGRAGLAAAATAEAWKTITGRASREDAEARRREEWARKTADLPAGPRARHEAGVARGTASALAGFARRAAAVRDGMRARERPTDPLHLTWESTTGARGWYSFYDEAEHARFCEYAAGKGACLSPGTGPDLDGAPQSLRTLYGLARSSRWDTEITRDPGGNGNGQVWGLIARNGSGGRVAATWANGKLSVRRKSHSTLQQMRDAITAAPRPAAGAAEAGSRGNPVGPEPGA